MPPLPRASTARRTPSATSPTRLLARRCTAPTTHRATGATHNGGLGLREPQAPLYNMGTGDSAKVCGPQMETIHEGHAREYSGKRRGGGPTPTRRGACGHTRRRWRQHGPGHGPRGSSAGSGRTLERWGPDAERCLECARTNVPGRAHARPGWHTSCETGKVEQAAIHVPV